MTIPTEGTLGEGQSADAVSDVFRKADEFFAGLPEGVVERPESEVLAVLNANDEGQTLDTTGTDEPVTEPEPKQEAPKQEAPKKAAAKKAPAKKAAAKKTAAKKTTTAKKTAAKKASAKPASKS
jgi:hypothetical protein